MRHLISPKGHRHLLYLAMVFVAAIAIFAYSAYSFKPPISVTVDTHVGMSVGTTLLNLSRQQLATELDDMASMGIAWVRIDFDWSVIQPESQTAYEWSKYDKVIAALNRRNIKILGALAYTPSWARPDGCDSFKCAPASDEQFSQFATAVVDRYKSQGLHYWEIWNEENSDGFWSPQPDIDEYADLLKAAYTAIKDTDSNSIVLAGGLAEEYSDDSSISAFDFLTGLYDAGAEDYFDAVAIHPYTFPSLPSAYATWNSWSKIAQTNPSLRSIMVDHGDIDKKIWITEYGAPTGGPDEVSETVQANILADAVTLRAEQSWAGPLFIYSYKDLGTNENTIENFFGILHYDGSAKPAYTLLKQLLSVKK